MLTLDQTLFDTLNARQLVGTQQPAIYGAGGIRDDEIATLQVSLGFPLPPDFIFLLQHIVDPGEVLFDYRAFDRSKYDASIERILEGLLFSFEHGDVWMKRWGTRPASNDAAKSTIRRDFATWPKLLPIHSHRYLAGEPCASNNPVFSIVGTDMVCDGANLAHYLHLEFLRHDHKDYQKHAIDSGVKDIPIWSDFIEMRSDAFVNSYFNR